MSSLQQHVQQIARLFVSDPSSLVPFLSLHGGEDDNRAKAVEEAKALLSPRRGKGVDEGRYERLQTRVKELISGRGGGGDKSARCVNISSPLLSVFLIFFLVDQSLDVISISQKKNS